MKLIHLGDQHLGKTLADFNLNSDQKYILDQILDIVDRESADGVLICGDVYDKSIPSEEATKLLDNFLSRLAEKNVKTFMISGNHDSDDRLNFGKRFFESRNVYISAVFNGTLEKQVISDGGNEVNFYLLPFVKASQVRHYYPDETIENYEDAVRVILDHTDIDENACNILLAHQFVSGKGEDPKTAGSEGVATLNVGTIEKIGYDLFDKFDYVALGHIHSPQRVGREEVRYAGSPLKYSLSEINNEKSVPLITIDGKNVKIDLIPLVPMRNMRHLRGTLSEILKPENVHDTDDFIYATLTDEEIVNDVMLILQHTYPYTVKIDFDNSHTREVEQVDISKIAKGRDFKDLIGDFYKEIYGVEISEEEMAVMRMVGREAGVFHEAD
ncbi:MAG: exonuclease SbcCD subunit D [Clostridiales bacterium]|nr:exonuclease SbcCD subunit D [Clostridiales bacterium]